MKFDTCAKFALLIGLSVAAVPAYAAEGSATGNGTSTLAGPAGDNKGPTKSGGAMSKDSATTGAATGTSESKTTPSGGQPGGTSGKN